MAKTKTPAHLVQLFGLEPEYPSVKLSGVWQGFRQYGPHGEKLPKKEFLSVMWALQFLGGIEEHGGDRNRVRRVPLARLARFLGRDVSTASRRIQRFTAPDGRWDEERRRRMSELQKSLALKQGKKLTGRTMRRTKRVHQFLNKNVGYGQAQLYTQAMPERLKPRVEEGKKLESATSNVELLAEAYGGDWFDPTYEGVNNYKLVPGYMAHLPHAEECKCKVGQLCLLPDTVCPLCDGQGVIFPHDDNGDLVPLADYGKNLLFHLVLKGIVHKGSVQRTLDQIAQDTGCDVNTIAKYRDELELLQIIRVITGDIKRLCLNCDVTFWCTKPKDKWIGQCPKCGATHGKVEERKPDKWIYVADLILDEETSKRAKIAARDFARAEKVHAELLKAWRGREYSVKAFFNEMRRRLASEGINKNAIDILFPFYRE